MSQMSLADISKHPRFIELVKKRHQLRVTMIGLMLTVFMSYLVAWAYFPGLVNTRLPSDSSVTIGIWFSVFVVLVAIFLSAYYAVVAGKSLDALNAQLIKEIEQDA
ncbi:MAG: DUF485 domain-containing protein [Alteromonadaceae bacterium]|jgi:uncharacterized membrane protein (DUF485 family)|uniref:DUF485 domain-containing protein n=2 Tax=Paraglaciecola chathamensis TaxID=368405 RepID=A0A8H9M5R6_9ALTE|nr:MULTISPECIES: DUF485 domain-containing protein [Paraglaciecola]AEE24412.1 protein of unknown function DUF485 [Glaciecola sp. 4H-3-7+YE-5]MBN25567.1 DUF485 domain-containing protein [Alteromonadaceae bacterium]GGZ74103.1 hypothetical protein GCM10011274_35570 [Paraglaciecola oceanifecundans]|tara:strand:+ start:102279 stop:102596 length:318 start_codon:yes stop_codon:yes gene_type:complete